MRSIQKHLLLLVVIGMLLITFDAAPIALGQQAGETRIGITSTYAVEIAIDGNNIGNTPLVVYLKPGTYELTATYLGYEKLKETRIVTEHEDTWEIVLKPRADFIIF